MNTKQASEKEWKDFEMFVADVIRSIEPLAEVKYDDCIEGRQIDVSIRKNILGIEILIIVQAKWYSKAVPIGAVDAFESIVRDTRAAKGIMIANKGFARGAKEKATRSKIDLCSAHDSSNEKWRKPELLIPVVRKTAVIKLKMEHTVVSETSGTVDKIGFKDHRLVSQEFLSKWLAGTISRTEGVHRVKLDSPAIMIPRTGVNIARQPNTFNVESFFEYTVEYRYHFKKMHPEEYTGLLNYITENFSPSFLHFKDIGPFENDKSWEYVKDEKDIAVATSYIKANTLEADLFKLKMVYYEWIERVSSSV